MLGLLLLLLLLAPAAVAVDSQGLAAATNAAAPGAAQAAPGPFDEEAEEKKDEEEKPTHLIAEAQEELSRDTAIVNTVSVEVERLQALWRKVFESSGGANAGDAGPSSSSWANRQELQKEMSQIQKSLLTLVQHMNETKNDLNQAHEAMEQKETLEDLEELVKEGKVGVNYETGELAHGTLGNLTSALLTSAAATNAEGVADAGKQGKKAGGGGGGAHGHGHAGANAAPLTPQQEVAAAVTKLQQKADPAVLHLDVDLLQGVVLLSVSTALGGFAATVCHLPTEVGYMVAGMLIGPSGLNLISKVVEVETLAQFGSIFLLYGHGMMYCSHYDVRQLGGTLSDTFAAGVLILSAIFFLIILVYTCFVGGAHFYQATLVASAVSLSSTTATAHALGGNRLRETGYGKTLIELMAVQDLLMAPLLSIPTAVKELLFEYGVAYILPILGCYATAITAAALLSKRFMPRIINLRNRAENSLSLDLFILGLVSYCLLMALLTEWMGLSYEAGALLAGLVLADVPHISKAVAVIEPLTCLFGGMYLGSLGMILSPVFLAHHAATIVLCVVVVLAIKILAVTLGMRALGYSTKASFLGALSMAHISELSLFLVSRAQEYKLISRHVYLVVVATTVVLLMLTPLSSHAFKGVDRSEFKVQALKSPFAQWWGAGSGGLGVSGTGGARGSHHAGLPYRRPGARTVDEDDSAPMMVSNGA